MDVNGGRDAFVIIKKANGTMFVGYLGGSLYHWVAGLVCPLAFDLLLGIVYCKSIGCFG
jgi:hypothetical protein